MKKEVQKQIEYVEYDNRIVPKEGFRVFIYGWNKEKNVIYEKLVNTYEEFEENISTGLWFAKKEDVTEKFKFTQEKSSKKPKDE